MEAMSGPTLERLESQRKALDAAEPEPTALTLPSGRVQRPLECLFRALIPPCTDRCTDL